MRTWLVYGAVVLVSVATGVMLGGGPTALLDSTDSASPVSSADDLPPPAPEIPELGGASATSPPGNSDPVETEVAETTSTTSPATTSTTSPATTSSTTTSTTSSTTIVPPPPSTTPVDEGVDVELVPRDELSIAVYNGIGSVGLAGRAVDALVALGYVDPATRDASPTARTLVYFRPGLEAEARRLAMDSGLPGDATESIERLTGLLGSGAGDFSLVLVLGGDRVGLAAA